MADATTPATPVPDAGRYALTEKDQENANNKRFTAGADFQGPVKVGGWVGVVVDYLWDCVGCLCRVGGRAERQSNAPSNHHDASTL